MSLTKIKSAFIIKSKFYIIYGRKEALFMEQNDIQIKEFKQKFEKIEQEIGSVIIGQKTLIRNVLTAMIAGGNVLLEGLPGLGKTQLVKTIGKVLDLQFSRIQFTPDLMPADVTGTSIMAKDNEGNHVLQFQKGAIFTNLLLADEINRATPKTQSALLEAMQEKTVTAGVTTYTLPEPFFVLATQNPLEMEGTYALPEAQMDRFLFQLNVDFPNKEELYEIVTMTTGTVQKEPQKVCSGTELLELRKLAKEVPVAKPVAEYAMDLILHSHPEQPLAPEAVKKYVRYGASPRGAQAIITTARIYALLDGRYHVAYKDIQSVAKPVLRHRIFLNFGGIAEGMTPDDIVEILLNEGENGKSE